MGSCSDLLEACDALGRLAGELGVGLLQAEDGALDGRHVRIAGRPRLHFSSCSYLGLELDPRLIEGACDAARRFGTQFSASRAFISAPPYAELEEQLGEITGGPTLVTPNTTLASAAALPCLVRDSDAVLLDHRVHLTVQLVVPQLQRIGAAVEMVRHGDLERLEARIRALRDRHRRIWLLLDGVYSMHGDLAPMGALAVLLARYEQLHLYVDDAHGMSWTGRSGRGWALDRLPDRSRVVVAVSLNKGFGAGGGALVFPDEATRCFVRHTAPPVIFSGPLQPPILGAALASARIHASKEIARLQEDLRGRIRHANRRAVELGLPLLGADALVPIRFVGLGPQQASTAMAAHLMERGLLPSCALFPAVPGHQTGIRFTLTRHHKLADIDRLLDEMAEFLPVALSRGAVSRHDVDRAFRLDKKDGLETRGEALTGVAPARRRGRAARAPGRDALRCEHRTRIEDVDREEWDGLLGGRGSFDWEGLRYLEETFGAHQKPESRWRFHYLHVRDASGAPILATFFSEAWMKDELLAGAAVSREVARRRRADPAFLTSRVLVMGSPLTEGDHLHLARTPGVEGAWRDALELMVAQVSRLAEESDVRLVALRDLPACAPEADDELGAALRELGFARMAAPDSLVLDFDGASPAEQLARLSKRARRHQRREVAPWSGAYEVRLLGPDLASVPGELWPHLYGLYHAVWQRSTDLVTFALPEDFLPRMLAHPGFEIVTLTLRPERGGAPGALPDAFFAARVGTDHYAPLVVGLDDRRVREHGAYRQCLATMIERARQRGARRLLLGMGAALEKQRFGARPEKRHVWIQSRDDFPASVLGVVGGAVRLEAS